jgi:iron-sulfur cluster repair protein YtfE (RIC family)
MNACLVLAMLASRWERGVMADARAAKRNILRPACGSRNTVVDCTSVACRWRAASGTEARNERDHVSVAANDRKRAVTFSRQLRQAHQHLRDQLTRIRGELGRNDHMEAGLQARCLAFCSLLTTHHVGEDDGMFRELLDARPDLATAIQNLIDDHAAMAAILLQVQTLATQAKTTPPQSLPGLRRELDGLAAIAESHFGYEERAISAVLDNDVTDTGWSRPVFKPTEPQRPVH